MVGYQLVLGAIVYIVGGYLSSCYVWNEDLLERLTGKNYVEQNLIPLFFLYFVGAGVTFVTWPLTAPVILVWRIFNKKG